MDMHPAHFAWTEKLVLKDGESVVPLYDDTYGLVTAVLVVGVQEMPRVFVNIMEEAGVSFQGEIIELTADGIDNLLRLLGAIQSIAREADAEYWSRELPRMCAGLA